MCASPRCTWSGGLRTAIPILYVLGFPIRVNLQPCGKICSVGVSIKIHFLLSSLLAYTTLSEPATGFCHLSHMRVMGVKSTCEIPRHGREVKNVIQIEHANVTPL